MANALVRAAKWKNGFVPKAASASILSFILSTWGADAYWNSVQKMRKGSFAKNLAQKYTPHHYNMGTSMIVLGTIGNERWYAPYAVGTGMGLIGSDFKDFVQQKNLRFINRDIAKKYDFAGLNKKLNMVEYDIPDWLPRKVRYDMIGRLLRLIVNEATYNKTRKTWIPGGKYHPHVIAQARKIIHNAGVDGRNKLGVVRAIQEWMQDNITYVYDPRWVETFVHPYVLLDMKAGDCDDQAVLAASMCESLGIKMALVLIAQRNKDIYNHVLSAYETVRKRLIPIETIKRYKAGVWPQHIRKGIITL